MGAVRLSVGEEHHAHRLRQCAGVPGVHCALHVSLRARRVTRSDATLCWDMQTCISRYHSMILNIAMLGYISPRREAELGAIIPTFHLDCHPYMPCPEGECCHQA